MTNERTEIGAAWLKKSPNGDEYISISIKPEALENFDLADCYISMMINNRKSSPTQPDYILTAKPKPQVQQRKAAPKSVGFPRPGQPSRRPPAPERAAPEEEPQIEEIEHQDLEEAAEELVNQARAKREDRLKDWFFRSKRYR